MAAGVIERLVEALRQVVVGGQRLGLDVAAVPGHEAVGEGAADVDGDPFHCRLPPVDAQRLGGTSRPSGITVPGGRAAHWAFSASTSISHVVHRRMAGRQVLGLDLGAAARAVVLEDPAPGRVGREGELVARRDRSAAGGSRADRGRRPACLPCSCRAPGRGRAPQRRHSHRSVAEVDLEVLGHRDAHQQSITGLCRSAAGRPPRWCRTASPAGTRMVKNGPSITAGPVPRAPGRLVDQGVHRQSRSCPPRPSRSGRVPLDLRRPTRATSPPRRA